MMSPSTDSPALRSRADWYESEDQLLEPLLACYWSLWECGGGIIAEGAPRVPVHPAPRRLHHPLPQLVHMKCHLEGLPCGAAPRISAASLAGPAPRCVDR